MSKKKTPDTKSVSGVVDLAMELQRKQAGGGHRRTNKELTGFEGDE